MSLIPGITLNLGGTDYIVPPMNLRIQLTEPTRTAVQTIQSGTADTAEFVEAALVVILACAQRNYPDMTRDQLLDIDFGDVSPLVVALMTKSGFNPRPLGQALPDATAAAQETAKPAPELPQEPTPTPSTEQPSSG